MSKRPPRGTRSLTLGSWLTIAFALLLSAPASAGTIAFDTWYEFGFTDAGTPATGCFPDDPLSIVVCPPSSGTPTTFLDTPPWTFGGSSTLTVVDAFESGDAFEIFDFGLSIGVTSAPVLGVDCSDDPVPCLANPAMSQGVFVLGAGAHSLTITPTLSPGSLGAAYLQVSAAAVPEPASVLLFGLGVATLCVRSVRRSRAS
jgi:hypothetical protein